MSHDWSEAVRRIVQGDPVGPGQSRAKGVQHPAGGAAGHRCSLPVWLPGSNRLLHLPGTVRFNLKKDSSDKNRLHNRCWYFFIVSVCRLPKRLTARQNGNSRSWTALPGSGSVCYKHLECQVCRGHSGLFWYQTVHERTDTSCS